MQISQITINYSRTQSLGNYSNVKPGVSLTAVIDETDDLEACQLALLAHAKFIVYTEIDNALEKDDSEPIFWNGPLHQVRYSDKRGVVVIVPSGADIPRIVNWRDSDGLARHTAGFRPETAWKAASKLAASKQFPVLDCTDGDFSRIPGLPDPGPEPAWSSKKLAMRFGDLRITDEQVMEELAQLDHVTPEYLRDLYRSNAERLPLAERIEMIRSGGQTSMVPIEDDEGEDEEENDED